MLAIRAANRNPPPSNKHNAAKTWAPRYGELKPRDVRCWMSAPPIGVPNRHAKPIIVNMPPALAPRLTVAEQLAHSTRSVLVLTLAESLEEVHVHDGSSVRQMLYTVGEYKTCMPALTKP